MCINTTRIQTDYFHIKIYKPLPAEIWFAKCLIMFIFELHCTLNDKLHLRQNIFTKLTHAHRTEHTYYRLLSYGYSPSAAKEGIDTSFRYSLEFRVMTTCNIPWTSKVLVLVIYGCYILWCISSRRQATVLRTNTFFLKIKSVTKKKEL